MDRDELNEMVSNMSVYELYNYIKDQYTLKNGSFSTQNTRVRNWEIPTFLYVNVEHLSKEEKEVLCKDVLIGIAFFCFYVSNNQKSFPIMSFFVVNDILKGKGNILMVYKKSIKWFSDESYKIFHKLKIDFYEYL